MEPLKPVVVLGSLCEHELMFIDKRLFLSGLVLWVVGTVLLRVVGHRILPLHNATATLFLLLATFPSTAWIVRRICRRAQLPRDAWLAGAFAIILPTLALDAFSAAFFPALFPNIAPAAAGVFGGWMLACCAGAVLGVGLGRRSPL
jgi:uncharacterized protein DUF5367